MYIFPYLCKFDFIYEILTYSPIYITIICGHNIARALYDIIQMQKYDDFTRCNLWYYDPVMFSENLHANYFSLGIVIVLNIGLLIGVLKGLTVYMIPWLIMELTEIILQIASAIYRSDVSRIFGLFVWQINIWMVVLCFVQGRTCVKKDQ